MPGFAAANLTPILIGASPANPRQAFHTTPEILQFQVRWLVSIPQRGPNERQVTEPKGQALGGSTAINIRMVIFPSKSGFGV